MSQGHCTGTVLILLKLASGRRTTRPRVREAGGLVIRVRAGGEGEERQQS